MSVLVHVAAGVPLGLLAAFCLRVSPGARFGVVFVGVGLLVFGAIGLFLWGLGL